MQRLLLDEHRTDRIRVLIYRRLAVYPAALAGREREMADVLLHPPVPSLSIDKIKALAVIV